MNEVRNDDIAVDGIYGPITAGATKDFQRSAGITVDGIVGPYRPKYFHEDGIAINGDPRVPAHPASHGCVRVSMAAMDYLWDEMPIGTTVLIYGSTG